MAVYDMAFTVAKGRIGGYVDLPLANDAIIAVPIETAGIESPTTLRQKQHLADLVAGSTNEQTTMGRKTLTGVIGNNDFLFDRRVHTAYDVEWAGVPVSNGISALVLAYVPIVGTSTDNQIIPLVMLDWIVASPSGTLLYQFPSTGWYWAQ